MILADLPTREQPEKMFFAGKNVDASTITTGMAVGFALGNSLDGVSVVRVSGTSGAAGFVGIASQDIPVNQFGSVQVQGFIGSILLSNVGTSLTINANDPLVPGGGLGTFFSGAPTYANAGLGFVMAASNVPAAISAQGYISGVIRTAF